MKITKMFNVLTPTISTKKSIGCDFFVPEITEAFLKAFQDKPNCFHRVEIKRDEFTRDFIDEDVNMFFDKDMVEKFYKLVNDYKEALEQGICPRTNSALEVLKIFVDCHVALKIYPKRKNNCIEIRQPLTIPTGICFDLPEDVFTIMCPKSSNIHNGYRVIHNTIDEDYVFGVGVQVEPVNRVFKLSVNQKLAQAIFMKKSVDVFFEEMSNNDFNELETVKQKKKYRQGGFGSTGLLADDKK